MKICFDARVIIDEETGLGNYTYNILKNLLEIDAENEYTALINKSLREDHPVKELQYKNLKKNYVEIRQVSPQQQLLVIAPLLKEQPDVYHYPNFDLPIFQPYYSVFTVHDLTYLRHQSLYMNGRWLKNWYTKHIMKLGAKKAKRIITVSQSTKQDLIEILNVPHQKIEVIYEAIDDSFLNGKVSEKDPTFQNLPFEIKACEKYFLFLGERRPHKNIIRIIEAFARFKKGKHNNFKLVIAGKSYSNYQEPEKMIKDLGLSNSVLLLGYVDESEKKALFKNTECFLFPSIYEGFGIPILEAMACGTPVITSNISSMPEIAGDAALIVNPYDIYEISTAIEIISQDTNLRNRLIKAGLDRIKDFSWKKAAEHTLKVYENIYRER